LRSALIDIGFFPKSAASESQPYSCKCGRTGMSSRSVATLLPARFKLSRMARLYRFRAAAPALSHRWSGLAGVRLVLPNAP
jgi:hypothetical protein